MLAVLLYPGGYLAELSKAGLAKPLPALLPDDQEPAVKEDLNVEGYGLTADIEFFRDGVYVMGLGGDHVDDGSPGGVGYGLVYVASGFHVIAGACYLCKQVLANIRARICLRKFIFWGDWGRGFFGVDAIWKEDLLAVQQRRLIVHIDFTMRPATAAVGMIVLRIDIMVADVSDIFRPQFRMEIFRLFGSVDDEDAFVQGEGEFIEISDQMGFDQVGGKFLEIGIRVFGEDERIGHGGRGFRM
jgi:hypothetical protein